MTIQEFEKIFVPVIKKVVPILAYPYESKLDIDLNGNRIGVTVHSLDPKYAVKKSVSVTEVLWLVTPAQPIELMTLSCRQELDDKVLSINQSKVKEEVARWRKLTS